MHPTSYISEVHWEEVTALTGLIALFGTIVVASITAIVDRRLAEFLKTLNGTYMRRELADARFQAIVDRLEMISDHAPKNHPLMGGE